MKKEYNHLELGVEVHNIAGYYVPLEEHIIPFDGKDLLFLLGFACIESSCCGVRSWNYIQVPGFLTGKNSKGSEGITGVSEVDTIEDTPTRLRIAEILAAQYPGADVDWW
jgi:hypothetical protein